MYVKPVKEPFNKTTNFVTAFGGAVSPQTYAKSEDSMSKLIINGVLYDKKNGSAVEANNARDWLSTSSQASKIPSSMENGTSLSSNRGYNSKIHESQYQQNSKIQESQYQRTSRKEVTGNGTEALGAALSTGHPETFQALFPYKPQNPDELELKENDIVYVVEKCDDGWYIGTSLRSGRFGTFPGNYVKAV